MVEAPLQASDSQPTGRWVLFVSTFTTVFLAELGDKTQLATLLLSAQSGRPLLVFVGAALALVSTSLVGVLLGQWLSRHVAAAAVGAVGRRFDGDFGGGHWWSCPGSVAAELSDANSFFQC